jgi:hypothetical protein
MPAVVFVFVVKSKNVIMHFSCFVSRVGNLPKSPFIGDFWYLKEIKINTVYNVLIWR